MQVQDRRRHLGLNEHVVNLPPVVRLVVEEMRDQQADRVDVGFTLVVHIADRPA